MLIYRVGKCSSGEGAGYRLGKAYTEVGDPKYISVAVRALTFGETFYTPLIYEHTEK
jgi:hypothetical protein